MVDDSAAMLDAANPTLQSVVGDNEEKCDTCKLIVTQVATMLRNPVRTQQPKTLRMQKPICMLACCLSTNCEKGTWKRASWHTYSLQRWC